MKRNKIYILIPIAAFIMLFTLAAVCGQPSDRETEPRETREVRDPDVLVSGRQPEEEEEEEEALPEEEPADLDQDEEEQQKEEVDENFPSITLVVYEGPSYSPGDDICFYRVKAEVSGNPDPRVEFSKDDSHGNWGPLRAQVNLTRSNPSYTLTATATNSHGTATDSITLNWGCGGETAAIDPGWQEVARISGQATAEQPEGEVSADHFDIESHFWRIKWTAQHVPAAEGDGFIEISVSDQTFFIDSTTHTISPGEKRESMMLSPGHSGTGTYDIRVKFRNIAYTVTVEQNLSQAPQE